MPFAPDVAKRAAAQERAEWRQYEATAALAGTLVAVFAGPGAVLPLAACALMVYRGQRKVIAADQILQDPPRDDFSTPTRARREAFNPEAFGQSELEQETVRASWSLI